MPEDPRPLLPALIIAVVLAVPAAAQDDEGTNEYPDTAQEWSRLHPKYGFAGMHISKLNDGVSNLVAGDVDGDGKLDLVVVNNARSKVELLLQGEPNPEEPDPELVNELADEARFRREAYPTEQKVSAVAVADVDRDGRGDLLVLGDSGKLTIAFRDEEGRYTRDVTIEVTGHSGSSQAIAPADVNQDGRLDVVVLGGDATWILLQDEAGRFTDRRKVPNATRDAGGFRVQDLDGDGRADLFYVDPKSEWPFRYRLGQEDVAFGPEIRSKFAELRSYDVGAFGAGKTADLVALRRRSGRLALLRFTRDEVGEGEKLPLSSLRSVPYEELKDADKREEVLADLDGDGRPELVVAEPAGARVVVHRALLGHGVSRFTPHPSFVGASRPRFADVDGDGRPELVVAAPEEGAIGVAEVDPEGDVGFPAPHAIPGGQELLAMDVADVDGDGTAEIWLVLGEGTHRSRARRLVRLGAAGDVAQEVKLDELKADPSDLWLVDLDRDGRQDALVFVPREVPTILLNRDAGFVDLKAAQVPTLGILQGRSRRSFAYGDVDGDGKPELLVPGPNFARAFHLDAEGKPVSVAQYNLRHAGADVQLVAIGELDGAPGAEIVVTDKSTSALIVLRPEEDGHREIGRVDLGGLEPWGMRVVDLDGNGRQDILVLGKDRFAVVQNGGADPVFTVVDDLEVPIKDAYLDQIAVGDVNGDGEADAVVTESNKHLLTISAVHVDELEYALKFPVFEERIFERGGRGGREPREVVVGDFTGDDRKDIAILVHDRLIVYPQE